MQPSFPPRLTRHRCSFFSALLLLFALVLAGCSTSDERPPESGVSTSGSNGSALPGDTDAWFEDDTDSTPRAQAKVPFPLEHDTVWPRLRNGLQLTQYRHPWIDQELTWYRQHPAYLYRTTTRAQRYLHHVLSEVEQRGMPSELALLPLVESGYNPFAYSRSGAAGAWQFMPPTADRFNLRRNWWYDGRKDVVASTAAALDYLQYLHNKFDDWLLAVAAYNFGEGSIQRAINANRERGKPTDFWHLTLRAETRAYVPKLLALGRLVQEPQRYGVSFYPIPDRPYFTIVTAEGQIDLSRASALAGLSADEIFRLNAGYTHGVTDPGASHQLAVPVEAAARFRRELPKALDTTIASAQRYTVVKGDTLSAIGRRFKVPVSALQAANGLDSASIRIGQQLIIPGGTPAAVANLTPPANARQVLHTVKAGEVLWRIARQYGVTPQEIQRWNGLDPDDGLRAGERLSIWTRHGTAVAATVATNTPVADTSGNHKVGYTVRPGDSLYAIATRFKVGVEDIVRWNRVNSHMLFPGQKLTLYVAPGTKLN